MFTKIRQKAVSAYSPEDYPVTCAILFAGGKGMVGIVSSNSLVKRTTLVFSLPCLSQVSQLR